MADHRDPLVIDPRAQLRVRQDHVEHPRDLVRAFGKIRGPVRIHVVVSRSGMVECDGNEPSAGNPLAKPSLVAPEAAVAVREQSDRVGGSEYRCVTHHGNPYEELVASHRCHRRGLHGRIPGDCLNAGNIQSAEADR